MNDPIEQRHNATNARIRAEAKAGKYWLVRCEGEGMTREELINKIIEDTMSGAIGTVAMPMGGQSSAGRNKKQKDQLQFVLGQLRNQKSSR